MINTAGQNVYSHEIELALSSVPGVETAVAAGMPDDLRGHRVVAGIVPSCGGLTTTSLTRGLEAVLSRNKRPLHYYSLSDLPLTDRGKVDRRMFLEWITGGIGQGMPISKGPDVGHALPGTFLHEGRGSKTHLLKEEDAFWTQEVSPMQTAIATDSPFTHPNQRQRTSIHQSAQIAETARFREKAPSRSASTRPDLKRGSSVRIRQEAPAKNRAVTGIQPPNGAVLFCPKAGIPSNRSGARVNVHSSTSHALSDQTHVHVGLKGSAVVPGCCRDEALSLAHIAGGLRKDAAGQSGEVNVLLDR
jgi:hypothetical protein